MNLGCLLRSAGKQEKKLLVSPRGFLLFQTHRHRLPHLHHPHRVLRDLAFLAEELVGVDAVPELLRGVLAERGEVLRGKAEDFSVFLRFKAKAWK